MCTHYGNNDHTIQKRVIITRPASEGEELIILLQQADIAATHLPLFNINIGKDLPKLQMALNHLSPSDIVIIVSPQISHILNRYQSKAVFPSTLHYVAIGKKSASLFSTISGVDCNYPDQENSEGLIAHLQLQGDLKNRNVLILRGEKGRELIGSTLTQTGAKVHYLQCYQREPINYNSNILNKNIHGSKKLIIVITSVDHLLQFEKLYPLIDKKENALIVTSERILIKAKQLGWQQIHLTNSANNKILVKTLTTLCHND